MTDVQSTNWNPGAYDRFRGLRLQPALDLLSTVGELPNGTVVDLGCGSGAMAGPLQLRFPRRLLVGVDHSPDMLEKAAETGVYGVIQESDIDNWRPDLQPALIFSNAALNWLDDHETLLSRLAGLLPAGGILAVQMPRQFARPSHIGWSEAMRDADLPAPDQRIPSILSPEAYADLLAPLGEFRVWQTEYFQELAPSETAHPVRLFTESTFGRPFLQGLADADRDRLIAAYERRIEAAYPRRPDGSVLFPFQRLFFTLRVF